MKFEYSARHQNQERSSYIRHIHEDEDFFSVCCFTYDQAQQFKSAKSIVLDTSYKRVLGNVSELTIVHRDQLDGIQSMSIIPESS